MLDYPGTQITTASLHSADPGTTGTSKLAGGSPPTPVSGRASKKPSGEEVVLRPLVQARQYTSSFVRAMPQDAVSCKGCGGWLHLCLEWRPWARTGYKLNQYQLYVLGWAGEHTMSNITGSVRCVIIDYEQM